MANQPGNSGDDQAIAASLVEPAPEEDREPEAAGAGSLASRVNCKYCESGVFLARCEDGKWRTFELADYPPTSDGVWVWHRRHGMQEYARNGRPARPNESLIPGKILHYCSQRAAARMRLDVVEDGPLSDG